VFILSKLNSDLENIEQAEFHDCSLDKDAGAGAALNLKLVEWTCRTGKGS
jgi:hypothetical protein